MHVLLLLFLAVFALFLHLTVFASRSICVASVSQCICVFYVSYCLHTTDGSCAYSVAEFDTFVRHNLPVIALVGNDSCWAQILRDQIKRFKDDVGCPLRFTDYDRVAIGYGVFVTAFFFVFCLFSCLIQRLFLLDFVLLLL